MIAEISTISFPGLGIGEFDINPIAFNIFGKKDIAWYGIIITTGIIAGFFCMLLRAKYEDINPDDILDLAIYVVIFGVIGARTYYVLTKLDNYHTFLDVISVWNGGIAIYGAIIAGGLTTYIVAKIKKIKPGKLLDMIGPAVMIGQIIGRWGNFTNAEAFGSETTLPWRMGISNINYSATIYVHPTFLYESLWNLLGFIWINLLYKKKKFDGQIFLYYVMWYGFGRMFIESLRSDSLYIGEFKISQLVGFFSFIISVTILIVMSVKSRNKKIKDDTENGENN